MCLGIPMKVLDIKGDEGLVGSGALRRRANLSLLKGVKKGDYVLVHAGFAIERVKEEEAKKTLLALRAVHLRG